MQVALFLIATWAVLTTAERSVIVLYNNGVPDPTAGSCSEEELDMTHWIIVASGDNSTYQRQRNLLRGNQGDDPQDKTESMMQAQETEGHRDLAYPNKCKNLCAGTATGYCQAVDCKGYRRGRDLLDQKKGHRKLVSGASFTCTQQVDFINTQLDSLVSENWVNESCKTLLMKPRDISCFDDVIYGVVESFKLWDPITSQVIFDNFIGQDVCWNQDIAFEAVGNDCIDTLYAYLAGQNSYYDTQFGLTTHPFRFPATKLLYPGNYTLSVFPDMQLNKAKSVQFNAVTGDVKAIALIDTTTKKVNSTNFTSGNTVCIGRPFTWEFTIGDCSVSFSARLSSLNALFTARESIQYERPFSMYGQDANGNWVGKSISTVGNYTLKVYPDRVGSKMAKTVNFRAVKC